MTLILADQGSSGHNQCVSPFGDLKNLVMNVN